MYNNKPWKHSVCGVSSVWTTWLWNVTRTASFSFQILTFLSASVQFVKSTHIWSSLKQSCWDIPYVIFSMQDAARLYQWLHHILTSIFEISHSKELSTYLLICHSTLFVGLYADPNTVHLNLYIHFRITSKCQHFEKQVTTVHSFCKSQFTGVLFIIFTHTAKFSGNTPALACVLNTINIYLPMKYSPPTVEKPF